MPVIQKWAYFDHAAVAPLPEPARQRMVDFSNESAEHGTTIWLEWSKGVETFRKEVAAWVGASSSEIAMIPNTSYGINLVAEGYPWQPGDNVVTFAGEFPSNRLPWDNQASRGVEVRVVPCPEGRVCLNELAKHIDSKTKIVAISWVGYSTGFRIDLSAVEKLVHERGALLFLDAIQGLGIYPLDVSQTRIDFLAADGHKWMLGPEGAGIAYIRQEHLDLLRCGQVGWHSVRNSHDFKNAKLDLRPEAARFEAGTSNMVGLLSFAESLRIFWQIEKVHGASAIGNRVLRLANQASEALEDAGAKVLTRWEPEHQSSIVIFDVPGMEPDRFRSLALSKGIAVSVRGGGVRASIHAYNNGEDIQKLATLVRESVE